MEQPRWLARIEVPGGPSAGSGFLVDQRTVLTWARVLQGCGEAEVSLMDGEGARPAKLVGHGRAPTGSAQFTGDLVVLELEDAVPGETAKVAPFNALDVYAGQRLAVVGFPEERGARITHCTADSATLAGHSTIDLKAESPADWNGSGFVGAAVYHPITHRVVGMMADPGEATMIPAAELARLWPLFDSLVDFDPFGSGAYRELREVLAPIALPPAELTRFLAVLQRTHPVPGRPTSVLAAAEAIVLESVLSRDEIGGVLAWFLHLVARLPDASAAALHRWADTHLWAIPSPEPTESLEPRKGAIVVQLAPVAGRDTEVYEMNVWTADGLDGELELPVVSEPQLSRPELRAAVERALSLAMSKIPMDAELEFVEFVLARDWLSEPVDEWSAHFDDNTPLGWTQPVVVRDLDWVDADLRELRRRVIALRADPRSLGEILQWRDCTHPLAREMVFKAWLRRSDGPLGLGLAGVWTHPEHLSLAVRSGLPVMLWRRAGCADTEHLESGRCPGLMFHLDLVSRLGDVTFDSVAKRVRDLRVEAVAEEDDQHCGNGLTLLRDDCQRRPMSLELPSS